MTLTPNANAMALYVIDDHPLMREAVVMLLRRLRPGSNIIELDRIGGVESAVKQHGYDYFCFASYTRTCRTRPDKLPRNNDHDGR